MINRKFGFVLSALVSLSLIASTPAFAAPSVNINVGAVVGDQEVDTAEIESAIAEYLAAHNIEVADDGEVTLDIGIAVDDDGEGFAVVMDWDGDPEAEETQDLDIEASSLAEGIVGLLDAFAEDMNSRDGGDDDGGDE